MLQGRTRAIVAAGLAVGLLLVACAWLYRSRDPEHLSRAGREALDAHELARAEALFRRALAGDPARLDALGGLGWTYLLAGQGAAAQAAFDRCVQVGPTAIECLRGQAAAASAEGELARARGILEGALQLDPDDAGVQSSLALLDLKDGDLESSAARYERLVARFPGDAEYALGLADVRLRQGRVDEALALVQASLLLPDTPLRTQAMLHLLHARVLVAAVSDRVDPTRCSETAPPLLAWLDAADRSVAAAEATGVSLPHQGDVHRLVGRSRGGVEDACPGFGAPDVQPIPTRPTKEP